MNKSGGGAAAPAEKKEKKEKKAAAGGAGGITLAEVGKHTTKGDCWVDVAGKVLNVTSFLPNHPGGELAILTFAGKDATEEFNMIHPPDVIPKYAPDAIIGDLGSGGGGGAKKAKKSKKAPAAAAAPAGGKGLNWDLYKKNQNDRMAKEGKIPGWCGALMYMVLAF